MLTNYVSYFSSTQYQFGIKVLNCGLQYLLHVTAITRHLSEDQSTLLFFELKSP